MATTSKPVAKKKTASSEIIVGQAATALSRSLKAAEEVFNKLNGLVIETENRQNDIAELETNIAALSAKHSEELRAGKIQVDLDLKAHGISAAQKIANDNGYSIVDTTTHTKTVNELSGLKADFDKKVSAEVHSRIAAISSDYANKIALKEAQVKAEHADLTSKLTSALSQNEFLQAQIEMWRGQLEAERSAGTARAQAASVGSVNVGIPGKN